MAWCTPFSKEEDQFIRKNYPAMGPAEIARHLGRSRGGVSNRINTLGLREASITRARVIDAEKLPKKYNNSLQCVAHRGDEKETLEALRDVLASCIDEAEDARDVATLSKRMLEVGQRITELTKQETKENKQRAEVTKFDIIAGNRARNRKASQG